MRLIEDNDVLVGVLPFFHIYANSAVLGIGFIKGCTIVILPKFDLQQFLEVVQNHKVTFAHIVPPIALALAKHPLVSKVNLSLSLSISFSISADKGAAPLITPLILDRSYYAFEIY